MRKISIVVNKNWEAEPMLAALCSSQFRPSGLPFPESLLTVKDGTYRVDPSKSINDDSNARAIFRFHSNNDQTASIITEVRVWCIQDFMDIKKNTSSSEEKGRFLPDLLAADNADLIIAVGTAGYIADNAVAGCVVVGSRFFVHNGHIDNPASKFQSQYFDSLLPQNSNTALVQLINPGFKLSIESKFLRTPNNPSARAACLASQFYTAISSVNVIDYGEYAWVDMEAVNAFRAVEKKLPVGSLETTHGVIRLSTEIPMIFVSAITDREGDFDIEVTAGQNYLAAFNAGIVLGQYLVSLNQLLVTTPDFSFENQ